MSLEGRTFSVYEEVARRTLTVDVRVELGKDTVDLATLCPPPAEDIAIYDPTLDAYLPLSRVGSWNRIPRFFFQPDVILMKYRAAEVAPSEQRKARAAERTICEVLGMVFEWRRLYSLRREVKGMTLQKAAGYVGISKKSLDDYYYQLRLAEYYRFDFHHNFHAKVREIRSYVLKLEPVRDPNSPYRRLPDKLRVLELFDPQTQTLRDHYKPTKEYDLKPKNRVKAKYGRPKQPNPQQTPLEDSPDLPACLSHQEAVDM